MNQKYTINKKRAAIFFVAGLIFLTLSIMFRKGIFVGLGGAMVGVPLAHLFFPYRSKAHHFFIFAASLAAVLIYIFFTTYLFWNRFTLP